MDDKKNILPFRQSLSVDEAKKYATQLAEEGKVILTHHARERMVERDVSFEQILNCLKKGIICEGPSGCKDGYKITMERMAAGEQLYVVCVLQFSFDALIVTVF